MGDTTDSDRNPTTDSEQQPGEVGAAPVTGSEVAVHTPAEIAGHRKSRPHKLEGMGYRKLELLRLLALGEYSQVELSRRYDVTEKAMSQFKTRHAGEIEALRAQADELVRDETSHIWISKKINRLAEYADIAETMASNKSPRAAEIRIQALKSAAEEMGQLSARTQIQVDAESVTYQVVGINVEDLT